MSTRGAPVWREPRAPHVQPDRALLPLLRSAVAAHPDRTELLLDLVALLRENGRWEEILSLLLPRTASGKLRPELAVELGIAAERTGDTDLALSALKTALDDADGTLAATSRRATARQSALIEMALLLARLGRHQEALQPARDALRRAPQDEAALRVTAEVMLQCGAAPALLDLLDELEAEGRGSTTLLACRANALAAAGRQHDLAQLLAPQRWCSATMIGASIDNDRVAQAILSHPALAPSPHSRATHGRNERLDGLAGRGDPDIDAVLALIRPHLDAYIAARQDAPHPLMDRRPAAVMLQGWALVTSQDGHETRHVHPRSWLTAVYYVQVPKTPAVTIGPPPGSVVFGPWPAEEQRSDSVFPSWHVEPRTGMLLIFPSFMAHRTMPTGVAEARLCLSLDIMPCAPPGGGPD